MFDLNHFDGAVIRFITTFSIIVIFFLYKVVKNMIQDSNNRSSSKELVTYSSAQNEDRKSNQKQNIYNKYYFNVYVKQPYNKNGKQNNYNNKANYKYQKENTDDIIDAEIVL